MPSIGLQLYVFSQQQFEAESERIVAHAAACGYAGVEGLPCYYQDYSSLCHKYHLMFFGPHVVAADLRDLEKVIAYCRCMGAQHVISSGLIEWDQRSINDYQQTAALLNQAAIALSKHQIQLHYHNHEFEFEALTEELTGMDILMQHTDAQQLTFCLDLGWVFQAGLAVQDFLIKHADRITYVHLRDFAGDHSVPLGAGQVPVAEIWKTIVSLPQIKLVMIEQDPNSLDPYADCKQSIDYLQTLC